jgi:hypothetical protein
MSCPAWRHSLLGRPKSTRQRQRERVEKTNMLRKGVPLGSHPASSTTAEMEGSGQWNLGQQTPTGSSDFVGGSSSTVPTSSAAEPTIIQLDDAATLPAGGGLDDGVAMMTGDTGMRARAAGGGGTSSSSDRPQLEPPRRSGTDPPPNPSLPLPWPYVPRQHVTVARLAFVWGTLRRAKQAAR